MESNRNNRKTSVITVRCTPEMERRIKNKSGHLGITVSEYALGWMEAGLDRKTRHDKKKARAMVEAQEGLNRIISGLGPGQEELRERLVEFSKEAMGIWDC